MFYLNDDRYTCAEAAMMILIDDDRNEPTRIELESKIDKAVINRVNEILTKYNLDPVKQVDRQTYISNPNSGVLFHATLRAIRDGFSCHLILEGIAAAVAYSGLTYYAELDYTQWFSGSRTFLESLVHPRVWVPAVAYERPLDRIKEFDLTAQLITMLLVGSGRSELTHPTHAQRRYDGGQGRGVKLTGDWRSDKPWITNLHGSRLHFEDGVTVKAGFYTMPPYLQFVVTEELLDQSLWLIK